MSRKILLTQGYEAIVDDTDYKWLNQWKWYAQVMWNGDVYAARRKSQKEGRELVYMHIQINDTPDGFHTDHRDWNTLNNRRKNLRTATSSQNRMNSKKMKNCTSRYKGVYWEDSDRIWRAYIGRKKIGRFHSEKDAALAYNNAAIKQYGEFAKINTL